MYKKNILVLNYEFPPLGGGASPISYDIAKGYVGKGFKVDVVTMGFKDLPKFETREGINIYRIKCLRSKKEICYTFEQLTFIISAIFFFYKHLKNKKYYLNHTHFLIPTGVVALFLNKFYNLDYIITSHGSDVLGYNPRFKYLYPFVYPFWKKIIKNARFVVTPSKFLQGKIKEKFCTDNLVVIPNGIDKKNFFPMKKKNQILIVARLFENKGVQDILDALVGVDLKDWKVKIVGKGPYEEFLKNKTKENGLSGKVDFLGWIDNKSARMRRLYGKAKIFVSASWFENMSMVILEASASGCKVIASNVGGNPEIVKKENLFEVRNLEDLKKKIENSITEDFKYEKLNPKFDLKYVIKKYNNIIK